MILGFENMLDVTRYGFSRGFDSFWDAEFVSIIPIYFADGVRKENAGLIPSALPPHDLS